MELLRKEGVSANNPLYVMVKYRFQSITDRMQSKHELQNPNSKKTFGTGVLFFPRLELIFREKMKVAAYLHRN